MGLGKLFVQHTMYSMGAGTGAGRGDGGRWGAAVTAYLGAVVRDLRCC